MLKIRVHEKLDEAYKTYKDFHKDYLKKLTPKVLTSLQNLAYGGYVAIPSKDGLTVLFIPDGYHLDLPKYIERDDAEAITLDAMKNDKGPFSPYYGAFELTWIPYYYKKDHYIYDEPYTSNMSFYLFGRKYINGNAYDYTRFNVSTSDPDIPKKGLSTEIAEELRI